MNYLSVKQAAEKWKMTPRRVQVLCNENRINGAQRVGNVWTIPEIAEKPYDGRKKIQAKKVKVNEQIKIERIWAMPNKNTFEIKPIYDLILEELTDGCWIDPFANRNKLATITNDLSLEFDTDYHLDALDFLKLFNDSSIDGVLYDPPYSPRQISECYNHVGLNVTRDTTKASFWGNHKREISRIVKIGGKVITFGWNSGGIGYKYGFEIERVLLVPHGGWHNDTICTVEIKTHNKETQQIVKSGNQEKMKKALTSDHIEMDKKLISILEQLPENYWDFKYDDSREYTHGIHSYPAMMVCPISRNVIKIVKQVTDIHSLFDPFAGSGTVLVEGMLANINCIFGNDINPLALFISQVKTRRLDMNELQCNASILLEKILNDYTEKKDFFEEADEYCQKVLGLDLTAKDEWGSNAITYLHNYVLEKKIKMELPHFKNIGYWFKPRVILQLQMIKNYILQIPNEDIRNFIFVAFSELIRFVSNRRNGEFKMFRMTPTKVESFKPNVVKEFITILERNIEKINNFIETSIENDSRSEIKIFSNNTKELFDVPDSSVDLVITSPPYGDSRTTVAYGEYSRLSLQWIDLFKLSDKEIMGIDKALMGGTKYRNGFDFSIPSETLRSSLERIKDKDLERAGDVYSFYLDLEKSIASIAKKTKKNGYQFWVVGNRTVKGELLKTNQIIKEIAGCYGLDYVYTINRNIINKVMPLLNSPTNETGKKAETMCNEHIVILRKK